MSKHFVTPIEVILFSPVLGRIVTTLKLTRPYLKVPHERLKVRKIIGCPVVEGKFESQKNLHLSDPKKFWVCSGSLDLWKAKLIPSLSTCTFFFLKGSLRYYVNYAEILKDL